MEARGTRTVATVVRAGPRTALVSLSGWYRGQVLVPVHTQLLVSVTGRSLAALPETQLLVTAHLGAVLEDALALRDWETL